tara:strand:+ start:125 stop:619 length:495 start_codon:yes stop_codon:yes gene_type:complete
MIISCPNCIKKFNIDKKLIPEKGRLLLCSSCNHKWHYKLSNEENETKTNPIVTKKIHNIVNKNINKVSIKPELIEKNNNKQIIKKDKIKNKNLDLKNKSIKTNFSSENLLNNLIIIFITFVAIILILDTFKNNIYIYFPILIPFLDNLYQSILDLSSFIKDLFN